MKTHRYTKFPLPFMRPYFTIIGIFFVVFGITSVLQSTTGRINPAIVFILFGSMAIFVSSSYPAIDSDEDGLFVHFCFFRLRVRWDDILDVKRSFFTSNLFPTSDSYVVRTKALTPFHRLYGLYSFSLHPSFVVHSQISGFPKLYASIKNKRLIQTNAEVVA